MLITGREYTAPVSRPTRLDKDAIKVKIRELVPADSDVAMYDCDIVKAIQETDNLTNDQVMECVNEIYAEYNPTVEE